MANESFHSEDPSLERTFRGHRDGVTACAFNPNMKQLVSSSGDHSLMIWNFKPSMRAYRFAGHKDSVLSVRYLNRIEADSCAKDGLISCRTRGPDKLLPHQVPPIVLMKAKKLEDERHLPPLVYVDSLTVGLKRTLNPPGAFQLEGTRTLSTVRAPMMKATDAVPRMPAKTPTRKPFMV